MMLRLMLKYYCSLFLIFFSALNSKITSQDKLTLIYEPANFKFDSNSVENYQEASLLILGEDYPIEIKSRGIRRKEMCSYTPIKFKPIKSVEYPIHYLNENKSMKLVRPCFHDSIYRQIVLREFLVYKMYSILTPYSFEVYWLDMEFVFPKGDYKGGVFLIESFQHLRERTGLIKYEDKGKKKLEEFDLTSTQVLALFQFMINNYDWSTDDYHNLKVAADSSYRPILIPYDFDYARMVNAPYASISDGVGVDSLEKRRYLGNRYSRKELEGTRSLFLDKKSEIYDLVNNESALREEHKKDMPSMLNSFYNILESKAELKKSFKKREITKIY